MISSLECYCKSGSRQQDQIFASLTALWVARGVTHGKLAGRILNIVDVCLDLGTQRCKCRAIKPNHLGKQDVRRGIGVTQGVAQESG